jgi:LacI family transcriptional regulator
LNYLLTAEKIGGLCFLDKSVQSSYNVIETFRLILSTNRFDCDVGEIMATIVDVASKAGVSVSTVSYALSGSRPISEETKQRIQSAITELGYQPNKLARSLVNRRSESIAVVSSRLEFPGPARTLVGIEQQANELGYSLILSLLHEPAESNVTPILDALVARRADGIIWAASEIGDNRGWVGPERLNNLPPIVFLGKPRSGLTTISADSYAGACIAVQHLIDQGCRTIALIPGPLNHRAASLRYAGWEETLQKNNLTPDPALVVEADWTAAGGNQATRTLLAQHPDVDAIFASSDLMALGVLSAARDLGRRVPDDLAVVGFDNVPESEFYSPPLTTMHTHRDQVGRMAVQELHRFIETKQRGESLAPSVRTITPELVVRASSVMKR